MKNNNEIEEAKIIGLFSETYPDGRIDGFEFRKSTNLHNKLISLFLELGFQKEEVSEKIDRDFIGTSYEYIFIYGQKIKAHIFVLLDSLQIIFDSAEDRKKIIKVIEKYANFPNDVE
ncbi:MAG: hypothetical protein Q8L29_00140 [archaeon]|nr:hypothetical protein [archaeon]